MSARGMTDRGPSAHPAPPPSGEYRWVYLWHWPIRAMHWIAAGSIAVLVVTGFYIGGPYFMTWGEASSHYLMGRMRFLHFAAAGVLVATGIVRVYWLFVGNRFERWRALFPVRKKDWVNLARMAKYYSMIGRGEGPQYLGHNPLQQLSYTGLYLVTIVMVLTGFTLYGQSNPGGLINSTFGWIAPLLGGVQMTRLIHHLLTWVFVIFVPIHVYLTLRVDLLGQRTGTISSIVSGGRFRPTDVEFEDDK